MTAPENSDFQTGRSSGLNETRPIIGWGRPLASVLTHYCGVVEVQEGGSVITACRGRWARTEPTDFIDGRDAMRNAAGATFVKCGACDRVAGEQRTTEGLRELRGALVIETRPLVVGVDPGFDPPASVFPFDLSDEGGNS